MCQEETPCSVVFFFLHFLVLFSRVELVVTRDYVRRWPLARNGDEYDAIFLFRPTCASLFTLLSLARCIVGIEPRDQEAYFYTALALCTNVTFSSRCRRRRRRK